MCSDSLFKTSILPRLLLIFSAIGALGLFFSLSTMVRLILAGTLALVLFCQILYGKEPLAPLSFRPGALILALTLLLTGFLQFTEVMAYTPKMSLLSQKLHISYRMNACLVAGLLSLVGFSAFYRLSCWMEENLCRLLKLPLKRQDAFPLSNLVFPLSALGFFLLESQWNRLMVSSLLAAVAIFLLIALHSPELLTLTQEKRGTRRLLALFTALGITIFRTSAADRGIFGVAAGILSLPFLYICLTLFYCWLDQVFEKLELFQDLTTGEKRLYLVLFLAAAIFTAAVFFSTDAFYATPYDFDIVYTADSPALVRENAFLSLHHPENDLRQPLFAVLAAPFLGLPYLLSRFLPFSSVLRPLLMDWVQIFLLLLTNFMLAKLLSLDSKKRMLFMGLTTLTYPVLLFSLMMEQYILVYFCLILCLSLLLKKKEEAELPLCFAGGTLLTSLILMPFLGTAHPIKAFKDWFSQMLTLVLSFLLSLLCFGRMDIILDAPTQLLMMLQFSGESLTTVQKLHQYSGFFAQCLFAPEAALDLTTMGHPSWQLLIPTGYSLAGLIILGLCILSWILNRKRPICNAAGLWLSFSFLILFVLGWGTKENGLILYTLYFGWAVWVLIYQLLERLEHRIPHITVILGLTGILTLAVCNFPAIRDLLQFACSYYPI